MKWANRPALKIQAEITQNRSSIIFIVPCERSSWSLLQKCLNCHVERSETSLEIPSAGAHATRWRSLRFALTLHCVSRLAERGATLRE